MATSTLTAEPPVETRVPIPPYAPRHAYSPAEDLAAANWGANLRALSLTQPDVIDAAGSAGVDGLTWAFARDGSLTALDESGRWWQNCSVPMAAARAMLNTLDAPGRMACFLNPTLAAHIAVALEILRPDQAIVAVVPGVDTLHGVLHCADLSGAISHGRLWFAPGERWAEELARLFQENSGLATPSQFIRLPLAGEEEIERMVAAAQQVFSAQNTSRAAAIHEARAAWRPAARARGPRLCALAPSGFRLWDDAGDVLAAAIQPAGEQAECEAVVFDPDLPRASSLLALAAAAARCDAFVAANVGRGDLPPVVPDAMPWITWVTTPRIPAAQAAGRADGADVLLLADASWRHAALAAGWPEGRVLVAGWPMQPAPQRPGAGCLAIVADTHPLDPPGRLSEFSSHLLLWQRLQSDIVRDPFLVSGDVEEFLTRTLRRFGVSGEGLDRRLFIDRLIVPGYQHGLARLLMGEKLPVRLYGGGWDAIEAFRPAAAGAISDRRTLKRVARDSAAFVHPMPDAFAHPVDALGRPVVRRRDTSGRSFVSDALRALGGRPVSHAAPTAALSLALVLRCLGRR